MAYRISTRAPGHGIDDTRMPRKGSHELPALDIPHKQLPTASATATRGQPRPIRTPGDACDDPVMSRQTLEPRAIGGIPHIHVAIITPPDHLYAVWTPRHVTEPGREPTPNVGSARSHPTLVLHAYWFLWPAVARPVPMPYRTMLDQANQP